MGLKDYFYNSLEEADEIKGGQDAGKLELVKTDLKTAREWAEKKFEENGKELDKEVPTFDKNYKKAQSLAGLGKTQRKDMPVINDNDVKTFQERLKSGKLDINKPFAKNTDPKNPFPEGLTGNQAEQFLKNGLKQYDGSDPDDQIKVLLRQIPVGDLKPIQKQIYFDKSMGQTAKFGAKGTLDFLKQRTIFICSDDNFIIDGHHRFLSGVLLDPSLKVNCLVIELPIKKLLPMAIAYGDAIGNPRNK